MTAHAPSRPAAGAGQTRRALARSA